MEEQLYFACLNYCHAFGHLLFEKDKIRRPDIDVIEKVDRKRMIEMEEKRIVDCFKHLKELVLEVE